MKLPLTEYIDAAMAKATYDKLDQNRIYGEIPDCPGVYAVGSTLRECENELQSVLEGWVLLGLRMGHKLPALNEIDLNTVPQIEPVDSV